MFEKFKKEISRALSLMLSFGVLEGSERYKAHAQTRSIMTVIVVAITLLIGIYVFSEVETTMPDPTNDALNETTSSVVGNVASGFDLMSIIPIVLGATVILGLIINFGNFSR